MRKDILPFIAAHLSAADAGKTTDMAANTEAAITVLKTEDGYQDGSEPKVDNSVLSGEFKTNMHAVKDAMISAGAAGETPWGNDVLKIEEANGATMVASEVISKLFNGLTANTEKFVETFYPVFISKDLSNTFTMSFKDAKYITKWGPDGYQTVSALDVATDRDLLEARNTRIYPIVSDENNAILDSKNVRMETMGSEEVETASYKFGKDINLIKSAQLGFKVAGIEDNITAIANTLWLEAVNISATKDAVVAGIKVPVRAFTGAKFNGTFTGSNAEVSLSFKHTLRTAIEDFKKADGTAAFAAIPGYFIDLDVEVYGGGSLTKNSMKLHATNVSVAAIYEGDVKLAPGSDKYNTVMTALGELAAPSYDLEIYSANTTLGFLGNSLIVEDRKKEYAIPFKTPTSVKSGIVDIYNGDTDASLLGGMISNNGDQISGAAISEFFNMVDTAKANHGRKGVELDAIGNEFIPAYFAEDSLDLNSHINNMETQNMPASVEVAIVESIKSLCFAANVSTKIGAITRRATSGKLKFAFVGDETIVNRAGGERVVFADDSMEISLVKSDDKRFVGRLLGSVVASGNDGVPNYFSCGFTGVVPTIVTEIVKTFGSDSVKFTTALPRFDSITLLNFALELKLTGIDSIYTK